MDVLPSWAVGWASKAFVGQGSLGRRRHRTRTNHLSSSTFGLGPDLALAVLASLPPIPANPSNSLEIISNTLVLVIDSGLTVKVHNTSLGRNLF